MGMRVPVELETEEWWREPGRSRGIFHGQGRPCHGNGIGKKEEAQARTTVPLEWDRKERRITGEDGCVTGVESGIFRCG